MNSLNALPIVLPETQVKRQALNPLQHPHCLSVPKRLTAESRCHEHLPFVMFLVGLAKPRVAVELGTELGDVYCSLCQAVAELELGTQCFAVGVWPAEGASARYEHLRSHHDPLYGRFSSLLRASSADAARSMEEGSVDLLFLDAHRLPAARRELDLWSSKLSRSAVVVLSGVNADQPAFSMWNQLARRHPSFRLQHAGGLGVVGVGGSLPRGLKPLFEASPEEAGRLQRFFFELGQRVADRAALLRQSDPDQLARLKTRFANFQKERRKLDQALRRAQAEREEALAALQGRVHEAEQLRHDLDLTRQQLSEVGSVLGWRLLNQFWRSRDQVLPPGSYRRRGYDALMGPVKQLLDQTIAAPAHRRRTPAPVQWARGLARTSYPLAFRPVQQLEASGPHRWTSLGSDPYFLLEGPSVPSGWVEVSLTGRAEPAAPLRLYVDHGQGFTEEAATTLATLGAKSRSFTRIVNLGSALALRLDPTTRPGLVEITQFTIRSVDPMSVHVQSVLQYVARKKGEPQGLKPLLRHPMQLVKSAVAELRGDLDEQVDYQAWVEQTRLSPQALAKQRLEARRLPLKPKISVVVPVYNPDAEVLRRCVASVRAQTYDHWELCLADDCSTAPHVRPLLEELRQEDVRIKVTYRKTNGHIAEATNSALALATGEFVALLDQDDELAPNALFENAQLINQQPEVDLIYSDEDKMDAQHRRRDPYFKPDWSPELLLSQMYIGHLGVYRRTVLEKIGGFRKQCNGSQDYDLALRFTESTQRIAHIPKVLYHWRTIPGSTAASSEAKPYAYEAAQRALTDALARRGVAGQVASHPLYKGHYIVHLEPDTSQQVSVIIPTRDRADLLGRCLESLFSQTDYPHFEVVVVDNGSVEPQTEKLLRAWRRKKPTRFKVLRHEAPFNFSELVNAGVAASTGELVVLLNNDTEIVDSRWMHRMAGYAQQQDIGAVGCTLLYPDRTIQHAGVLLAGEHVAAHGHERFPAESPGYFGRLIGMANYSAVTGACLMVKRELFDQLQGFDPALAVSYNDVDFCLRLGAQGKRNVCLGQVTLLHHESQSRGYDLTPEKRARLEREKNQMHQRWGALLDADPYFSPHLRKDRTDFVLSFEGLE